MKRLLALVAVIGLAGCLPPVNADTAELAWERCEGQGYPGERVSQCSIVIDFEGTTPERRAAALINRGAIRSNEGQYARALADFGRALRINPNNAQVFFERGLVHQARGVFELAVRDFDRALALQPGLQPALDRRAEVLAQRISTFQMNLTALNERIAETPNDADLLNNRCWLRVINNDSLDAALADCNASLVVRPNEAAVLDSRGLVHFKRGEFAEALADYEAALVHEPESGHYLYGRGLARLGLGLTAEGDADLTRAEDLRPGITQEYQSYGALPPILPAAAPTD